MGDYGGFRRMGCCRSKTLWSRLEMRWSAESPAKSTTKPTCAHVAEAFSKIHEQ